MSVKFIKDPEDNIADEISRASNNLPAEPVADMPVHVEQEVRQVNVVVGTLNGFVTIHMSQPFIMITKQQARQLATRINKEALK